MNDFFSSSNIHATFLFFHFYSKPAQMYANEDFCIPCPIIVIATSEDKYHSMSICLPMILYWMISGGSNSARNIELTAVKVATSAYTDEKKSRQMPGFFVARRTRRIKLN
jgi:hypothetical protein